MQERNDAKRWNLLSPFLQSAALRNGDKQSIDGLLDQTFQADAARRDGLDTKWKRIGIIFLARRIPQGGVAITPLFSNCVFRDPGGNEIAVGVREATPRQWIPRL